jgi:hypothetical protein
MRRIAVCLFAVVPLLSSCDKETQPSSPGGRNFAPEILHLSVIQPRVHAFEEVNASCTARDRDGDFLAFWWETTAGTFPRGSVLSSVSWRTPTERGIETLTVTVTDFHDTVTADLPVTLATVVPPRNLQFINGATLIDLSWQGSLDESVEAWSGYELYLAPRDPAGLPPDSVAAYRVLSTPLGRRQYRVSPVTPGERVFLQVRSRRDYAGVVEISEDGPTIETATRLDGLGAEALFEVRSRRGARGVRLPGGSVVTLDPAATGDVDL